MKHHDGPKFDVKHIDEFASYLEGIRRAVKRANRAKLLRWAKGREK